MIEGITENKGVQLHEQNPTQTSKTAHPGPKKSKTTPKLSQIQMSELKEYWKIKVVQLYEQTPNSNQPP